MVSVRWSYPTMETQTRRSSGLMLFLNERQAREIKQNTVFAVEELKSRVGSTEIEDDPAVKEIIKEVIVKIRSTTVVTCSMKHSTDVQPVEGAFQERGGQSKSISVLLAEWQENIFQCYRTSS